jgi:integrase
MADDEPEQLEMFTAVATAAKAMSGGGTTAVGASAVQVGVNGWTFGGLLDWYEQVETVLKAGRRNEESTLRMIRRHLGEGLLMRCVSAITPEAIAEYCARRRFGTVTEDPGMEPRVSDRTLAKELSVISSVFKAAKRKLGLAVANPVSTSLRPSSAGKCRQPLDPKKLYMLIAAAELYEDGSQFSSVPIVLAIHLSKDTGIRLKKLCALKWSEINEDKGEATVGGRRRVLSRATVEALGKINKNERGDKVFDCQSESIRTAFHRVVERTQLTGVTFDSIRLALAPPEG